MTTEPPNDWFGKLNRWPELTWMLILVALILFIMLNYWLGE